MKPARLLAAAAALLLGGPARPCSITTSGVAFGAYSFLSSRPLDATGDVVIACPAGTRYTMRLEGGEHSPDGWRWMTRGAGPDARLRYQLFLDSGFRAPWGDGTGLTLASVGVATGAAQHVRVYGRILPRQPVPAGHYGDTLTLTIEW